MSSFRLSFCLVLLALGLFSPQTLIALPVGQTQHPTTTEEFGEALGIKRVWLLQEPNLELWCDDSKQFKLLEKEIPDAWKLLNEWFKDLPLPEGSTVRVVILRDKDALKKYPTLLSAEAQEREVPLPTASLIQGVINSGSAYWSNPPVVFIYGQILHKDSLVTRVVHDLGVIRSIYAMSPYGADAPEFFKEGVAGKLMRDTLKKPAGLVSHKDAAQADTIHGYGVFAGIGAAMNDHSNHPGNWPGVMKNGVKAMRRSEEMDPKGRIDGLLQRDAQGFARTDYAYAWAVVEFLMDERLSYGSSSVDAMREKRWKPAAEHQADNRRKVFLKALSELRHPDYVLFTPRDRGIRLAELLREGFAEEEEEMHEAFMLWVEKAMPKK